MPLFRELFSRNIEKKKKQKEEITAINPIPSNSYSLLEIKAWSWLRQNNPVPSTFRPVLSIRHSHYTYTYINNVVWEYRIGHG
jgi:hypothetical protein